jgi:CRISPR-associated protein Cmr6
MRDALRGLRPPDHVGLAYGAWAPVERDGPAERRGKVPDATRADWLDSVAEIAVSHDYNHAFNRWRASFRPPRDLLVPVVLHGRLLVGHGNPSPTDVGLTVHHTWGVPVVPGSALKGLTAHYVDAVYGPIDPSLAPSEPDDHEERARYHGITWSGSRIQRAPGDVYRALFGAPDSDDDRASAACGKVVFHDALYVPGSVPALPSHRAQSSSEWLL